MANAIGARYPALQVVATATSITALAVSCGAHLQHEATAHGERPTEQTLPMRAVSPEPAVAATAIAELRARGPQGLDLLVRAHRSELDTLRDNPPTDPSPATERLRRAVDRVSGQRDGHVSRLFWFQDLSSALAEARHRNVPVLSLRLLGRLDEELSCANSRLFRILLYSNPQVAQYLREHFVLHWSSERPAPIVTIDMGDGRRLRRTITGNSVHYVLASDGRVADALVGLYAPDQFVQALGESRAAAECAHASEGRETCLRNHHRATTQRARQRWNEFAGEHLEVEDFDAMARAVLPSEELRAQLGPSPRQAARNAPRWPTAQTAMPLTVGKLLIESPTLELIRAPTLRRLRAPEVDFQRIASLRGGETLADPVRNLLRLKARGRDLTPIEAWLRSVSAADGMRNEFLYRPRIRERLERGLTDFESLNREVYRDLLLTPAADPWLGLRPDEVYDAIETAR